MEAFFNPRGVKSGLAAGYVLFRIAEKVKVVGECWEWQGATNQKGYGVIHLKNHPWPERTVAVHRLVYDMCVGSIEGICVLHRCDNPACVRPSHLFSGSNQDNIADKVSKGRQAKGATVTRRRIPRGEDVKTSRLFESDVREIKRLLATGRSQLSLSKQFGVSQSTLNSIATGKAWKHVT